MALAALVGIDIPVLALIAAAKFELLKNRIQVILVEGRVAPDFFEDVRLDELGGFELGGFLLSVSGRCADKQQRHQCDARHAVAQCKGVVCSAVAAVRRGGDSDFVQWMCGLSFSFHGFCVASASGVPVGIRRMFSMWPHRCGGDVKRKETDRSIEESACEIHSRIGM